MGRFRISYFDVVQRALGRLDARAVGKAVERLSATYRGGRHDFDFRSEVGRAAYLWHHLPAHVCDLARRLEELLPTVAGRERLRVVALGAGPGSEILGLLEALTRLRARGDLEGLREVHALRVDRERAWDASFAALLPPALELLRGRDPGLETQWRLHAPLAALRADLRRPPAEDLLDAVREADLIIVANLLSELAPRGGDELPGAGAALFGALFQACRGPCVWLCADRAGAPGVAARLDALQALARASVPAFAPRTPRVRTTRCGCALTRGAQAVYRHVRLPTTRDADRPAKNCKTLWLELVLPE